MRYRRDGYISDMDAGFYSADYLRAWIRSAQLRAKLRGGGRRGLVAEPRDGRAAAGAVPRGHEAVERGMAARLGFDPLDTKPLLHELGAAAGAARQLPSRRLRRCPIPRCP